MQQFWQELTADWPSQSEMISVVFRICVAGLAGALPGIQREFRGVAAGLRTHILVSVGAALFVIGAVEAGAPPADVTRVIQGIVTGIGFVGGGAILKSERHHEIHGLTTAASVWLTAGLGTAAGLGRYWLLACGSIFALIVLSWLKIEGPERGHHEDDRGATQGEGHREPTQ